MLSCSLFLLNPGVLVFSMFPSVGVEMLGDVGVGVESSSVSFLAVLLSLSMVIFNSSFVRSHRHGIFAHSVHSSPPPPSRSSGSKSSPSGSSPSMVFTSSSRFTVRLSTGRAFLCSWHSCFAPSPLLIFRGSSIFTPSNPPDPPSESVSTSISSISSSSKS